MLFTYLHTYLLTYSRAGISHWETKHKSMLFIIINKIIDDDNDDDYYYCNYYYHAAWNADAV